MTIEGTEKIPINNITVEGLPFGTLSFFKSGTYGRYTVNRVEFTAPYDYGYGYGYGYGYTGAQETSLKYKITVDTNGAGAGDYSAQTKVYSENKAHFLSSKEDFKLTEKAAGISTAILGGAAEAVTPPGATTITTDQTGTVTSTMTAYSADGKASVTIPAGTIARDAAGNPLTTVTVTLPSTLPAGVPSGLDYAGYAVELGPAGATFRPPVAVCITFDPADIPPGKTPKIFVFEAGVYKPLDTTVVGNKACASVDHFSIFVLFAESAVPTLSPTPVATPTAPPPVTPTPVPMPTPPPFPMVPLVIIIVIVAVVIIAAVAYMMLKTRK